MVCKVQVCRWRAAGGVQVLVTTRLHIVGSAHVPENPERVYFTRNCEDKKSENRSQKSGFYSLISDLFGGLFGFINEI